MGNLVNNAVSYGNRAPIFVDLDGSAAMVSLKVSNGGLEIPAAEIPDLFGALKRGREVEPGTDQTSLGLGLFIVKQIAAAHDGGVVCQSSATRTTFEIRLPRAAIGLGS